VPSAMFDDYDDRPRGRAPVRRYEDEDAAPSIWRRIAGERPADRVALGFAGVIAVVIAVNALGRQTGPHPAPMFSTARIEAPTAAPVPAPKPADIQTTASITPHHSQTQTSATQAAAPATAQARPRAEIVADIQKELSRRGLYDGALDGRYGPRTDAAIRDFETQAGLRQTGEPTEQVLAAMRRTTPQRNPASAATSQPQPQPRPQTQAAVPASTAPALSVQPTRAETPQTIAQLIQTDATTRAPTVTAATSGPEQRRVLAAERALSQAGYGPIQVDGRFGIDTREAIQRFERDRKLPITGQVNDRLMRELAAVTGMPVD